MVNDWSITVRGHLLAAFFWNSMVSLAQLCLRGFDTISDAFDSTRMYCILIILPDSD